MLGLRRMGGGLLGLATVFGLLAVTAEDAAAQRRSRPKISKVTPKEGPQGGGTVVTITGTGFKAGARVLMGGREASSIDVRSSTELVCTTPNFGTYTGTVPVSVINADKKHATKFDAFKVVKGATKPPPAKPPTVSGVTPNSGPAKGGTRLTVAGANFKSGAKVSIGGKAALAVVFRSATQLEATTPVLPAGKHDVVVTNADGKSGTGTGLFTAEQGDTPPPPPPPPPPPAAKDPQVLSAKPDRGPTGGGTRVVISGANFKSGAKVTFGGKEATRVRVRNSQTIEATTPAMGADGGPQDIVVTNSDGKAGALKGGFQAEKPPEPGPAIESVTPGNGPNIGGTPIVIRGSNFKTGATVTVGGKAAKDVRVRNATTIEATTVPAGPIKGRRDVVVTNPDGKAATGAGLFTFTDTVTQPPPAAGVGITAVRPNQGPNTGGTRITVSGRGFVEGAKLSIGGRACAGVRVRSATTLTAFTPRLGNNTGKMDVVVTNPDGKQAIQAGGFEVTNPPAPTVTGVEPGTIEAKEGQTLTIQGTNFARGARVSIAGAAATKVRVVSPTRITAVTPDLKGRSGKLDVTVMNRDGQVGTGKGLVTIGAADPVKPPPPVKPGRPQVTAVEPAKGPVAGGTVLTITGKDFDAKATVQVAGRAASNVQVLSKTRITAVTPSLEGLKGPVAVQVRNPGAAPGVLDKAFTVEVPDKPVDPEDPDVPVGPTKPADGKRPWGEITIGSWLVMPSGSIRNKDGSYLQFSELGTDGMAFTVPHVELVGYAIPSVAIGLEYWTVGLSGSEKLDANADWGGVFIGSGTEIDTDITMTSMSLWSRYNVWNYDRFHFWVGGGIRAVGTEIELGSAGGGSKTENHDSLYPYFSGTVLFDAYKYKGHWLQVEFAVNYGGLWHGLLGTERRGHHLDIGLRGYFPIPMPKTAGKYVDLIGIVGIEQRRYRNAFEDEVPVGDGGPTDSLRMDALGVFIGIKGRF